MRLVQNIDSTKDSDNVSYMDPKHHLLLARDCLMLAFLATQPLRRNSTRLLNADDLGDIEIDALSVTHVQIDESRMKSGRVHDFVVDAVLDPWIKIYLHELRRLIAPRYDGPAFWVSTFNSRMSRSSINRIVLTTSKLVLGVDLRPHDFRRVVASNNIETGAGPRLLTHNNVKVTEIYQDQTKKAEVSRVSSLQKIGDRHER